VVGGFLLAAAGLAAVPAVAVAALVAAAGLVIVERHGVVELPRLSSDARVAWIDLAHGNRVDLHSGDPQGISGFVDHLWRGQYLPLGMKEFSAAALQGSPLFATVAPAFPFSAGERLALVEFVDGGGILLVASGYEESAGVAGLLAEFGYAIGSTPIGAAHTARTSLEGEHAIMHESWPVLFPEGRAEVWVESWGYPLVTFERIGRGGLLVIGDSFFLGDDMLEGRDTFVEPNIDFLRAALETAHARLGGGGGAP
jgi:hypothetical protein